MSCPPASSTLSGSGFSRSETSRASPPSPALSREASMIEWNATWDSRFGNADQRFSANVSPFLFSRFKFFGD